MKNTELKSKNNLFLLIFLDLAVMYCAMHKINKTPLKHISAQILTSWTRDTNPGCKLLPGNRVRIKRTSQYGKVIAVSTVDGKRITNNPPARFGDVWPTRAWTTYYVQSRGNTYSFNSADLTFAPYYQTA